MGAELTRLGPEVLEELSETQVAAGELIGRIDASFCAAGERLAAFQAGPFFRAAGVDEQTARIRPPPSHMQSPSYALEFRAQRTQTRDDDELERIASRWKRLNDLFNLLPAGGPQRIARDIVLGLCVEDRAVPYGHLQSVRIFLDRVALEFGIVPGARTMRSPTIAPIAITARRPARRSTAHIQKSAWLDVESQQHPEATAGELEAKWQRYQAAVAHGQAKADRTKFRKEKRSRRRAA